MAPGPLPSSQFAWDITSCRLPLHARWPFWGLNPPAHFSANGSVPPSEGRAGSWRAGSPAHSSLGPRGPAHSRHSGDDCKWVLMGLREHEGSPGRRREGSHTLQASWPSICLSVSWSIEGGSWEASQSCWRVRILGN